MQQTADEIEKAVREVLSAVLEREGPAGEAITRETDPTWDSLKHVQILYGVEDALDIEFDESEMAKLDSLEKLQRSAERHLAS